MDKETLKETLIQLEQDGIADLHEKGYTYFKSNFIPYLYLAEDELEEEAELLADCWYLAGDVYDFNGAPQKAAECYLRSIEHDEEIDGAYREVASMYEQMGRYEEALKYINIAIEKMPDDEDLLEDREILQDSINYNTEPYLTKDNIEWQLCELLAQDKIDEVIEKAKKVKNPEIGILQCLARAYGAKNEGKLFMETWQKIADADEDYILHYGDWFFMPAPIFHGEAIWQLIKKTISRIEHADFIRFDSLWMSYGEQLEQGEQVELICDYMIYKATKNEAAIKKLGEKYPLWEEVKRN